MSKTPLAVFESVKMRSALVGYGVMSVLAALFTLTCAFWAHADTSGARSQTCKEAAANKWLLDYSMEHGNPSEEQILEAVRQVSVFSEAIRKFCGDNKVNNEILLSAKQGSWPDWIDPEIRELLSQLGLL